MKKPALLFALLLGIAAQAQEFFLLNTETGLFGMRDPAGKTIPSVRYYAEETYPVLSEGLVRMFRFVPDKYGDSTRLYGYIDENGTTVIPFKYIEANDFYRGVAFVSTLNEPKTEDDSPLREEKIIDKTGREYPISSEYRHINAFQEGMAAVVDDMRLCSGKWGFIDSLGREITPLKYDQVWDFSEGMAAVNIGSSECTGGKWGFIDKTGKEVIPLIYDYVGMIDSDYDLYGFQFGKAIVGRGDEIFYIDRTGKQSEIPPRKKKKSSKYVETPLKKLEIVPAKKYRMVSEKSLEGLFIVYGYNNKMGYIDEKGREIIPCIYDRADDFFNGKAKVKVYDRHFYIDKQGRAIKD